jgi:hypothetical protein
VCESASEWHSLSWADRVCNCAAAVVSNTSLTTARAQRNPLPIRRTHCIKFFGDAHTTSTHPHTLSPPLSHPEHRLEADTNNLRAAFHVRMRIRGFSSLGGLPSIYADQDDFNFETMFCEIISNSMKPIINLIMYSVFHLYICILQCFALLVQIWFQIVFKLCRAILILKPRPLYNDDY